MVHSNELTITVVFGDRALVIGRWVACKTERYLMLRGKMSSGRDFMILLKHLPKKTIYNKTKLVSLSCAIKTPYWDFLHIFLNNSPLV